MLKGSVHETTAARFLIFHSPNAEEVFALHELLKLSQHLTLSVHVDGVHHSLHTEKNPIYQ
jgi:hypothetical protein